MPSLLMRLRPAGPWRLGSGVGARDRVDRLYHSDTLYSAVSIAMEALGWQREWFAATAHDSDDPHVKLTSLFPSLANDLLVPAPASLWPPANVSRLRASGARYIPARVLASLIHGEPWREENFEVDGLSACLVRRGHRAEASGPYRIAVRARAAVDRADPGVIQIHQTACLEYSPNAGLWCAAEFVTPQEEERWSPRVEACLRLLADTGLGGERSNGWGHFSIEKADSGELSELLLGVTPAKTLAEGEEPPPAPEMGYLLLSLFAPHAQDSIDWTRGSYEFSDRGGRIESAAGWGILKKPLRMLTEGSVLLASRPPRGRVTNVAPEDFAHPVYRAGYAVTIPVPWRVNV